MQFMRLFILFIFSLFVTLSFCQDKHNIVVFFRHGSKPYREHKRKEIKETGGMYGGHVSIGFDSIEFGFDSGEKIKLFGNKKYQLGFFYCEEMRHFLKDTATLKYTTIEIPISSKQYFILKNIYETYLGRPPYDYAFFGMRCTSATYDILSQMEIVKPLPKLINIFSNFYPRLLRRKMIKLSKINHYRVTTHNGRKTRIWDND